MRTVNESSFSPITPNIIHGKDRRNISKVGFFGDIHQPWVSQLSAYHLAIHAAPVIIAHWGVTQEHIALVFCSSTNKSQN